MLLAAVFRDGIRAVECIVQAAPAGVGSVQREARIGYRDDELRSRHLGDFTIDVCGFDFEGSALRDEVANLPEKRRVLILVPWRAGAFFVPRVDERLDFRAFLEQRPVQRRQVVDNRLQPGPEPRRFDADRGQQLVLDELTKYGCYRQRAGALVLLGIHFSNHR